MTDHTSASAMFCKGCGYDLRATTESRCPECGRGFDPDDARTLCREPRPAIQRRLRIGIYVVSGVGILLHAIMGSLADRPTDPVWLLLVLGLMAPCPLFALVGRRARAASTATLAVVLGCAMMAVLLLGAAIGSFLIERNTSALAGVWYIYASIASYGFLLVAIVLAGLGAAAGSAGRARTL